MSEENLDDVNWSESSSAYLDDSEDENVVDGMTLGEQVEVDNNAVNSEEARAREGVGSRGARGDDDATRRILFWSLSSPVGAGLTHTHTLRGR